MKSNRKSPPSRPRLWQPGTRPGRHPRCTQTARHCTAHAGPPSQTSLESDTLHTTTPGPRPPPLLTRISMRPSSLMVLDTTSAHTWGRKGADTYTGVRRAGRQASRQAGQLAGLHAGGRPAQPLVLRRCTQACQKLHTQWRPPGTESKPTRRNGAPSHHPLVRRVSRRRTLVVHTQRGRRQAGVSTALGSSDQGVRSPGPRAHARMQAHTHAPSSRTHASSILPEAMGP